MAVQITIRNVPDEVRDELAVRAAARRQSMQEYLRLELERLVSRPSIDTWLGDVRRRKSVTGTRLSSEEILTHRDRDRR